MHVGYPNIGFLEDFASHSIFKAFAGFNKPGDSRISTFRPTCLSTEQASFTVANQHDDGGINARKDLLATFGIQAKSGIAATVWSCRRAAAAAEQLRGVPQHEASRMRGKVGFISRQHRAKIAEVVKLTQFCKWRCTAGAYGDGYRRNATKQTEEGLVMVVQKRRYLLPIE